VSDSFAEYLQSYEESWFQLQEDSPRLPSYENQTLYTTWSISLNNVKQQNSLAVNLLQLWAYFDNQDVWLQLLQEGRNSGIKWFCDLTRDRLMFNKAIRVLCDHALVEADSTAQDNSAESRGYSMHSCVHSWTVHVLNQEWDANMASLALNCVGRHMPDTNQHNSLVTERRLMRHAVRSWGFIVDGSVDSDGREDHLHNFGDAFARQGRRDEAEKMYQRALQGKEKAWGPEHTSTIKTVNNLGNLYVNLGRLDEAEKMFQRALQGKEKAWGLEHTSTLETGNNLGVLYADLGRLDEAEKLYQRALQGKEKAWGPEHTSTLDTVNNLGALYAELGRLDEAEKMFQRALQGKEKACGPEQISTLETVNNLGVLYAALGRLDEAEKMYHRALQGYEKRLGYEHKRCCSIRQAFATIMENVSAE
jgi:tetratricopeptide (TPR) repeat protein